MAGTKLGGLKARDTNKAREAGFYSRIGRLGGKNGHTGGFYANRELARIAGKKGGTKSRRGKPIKIDPKPTQNFNIDDELELAMDDPLNVPIPNFLTKLFRRNK